MRFAHYLEEFPDNEGFLQATHQAGLQVEKNKALKQAREAARSTGNTRSEEKKKDEKKKNPPTEKPDNDGRNPKTGDEFGKPGTWGSYEAALEGVPRMERAELRRTGCHRCGRTGHRSHKCYARTTAKGTELPQAPSMVSAGRKRGREEENDSAPKAKTQKVLAAEAMDAEPTVHVKLERPVNVGVTVILSWSGFSIVTKEMGRARSSPAFSYYTGITPPMTILPSSPTVKGFTANNLRGSVRYLQRPLAAA